MEATSQAKEYALHTIFGLIKAMIEEKDLYSLLDFIHNQSKEIINAERCTIFIYDRKKNELWNLVSTNLEVKEFRLPIDRGIAGYVASSGKSLMVNSVRNCPLFDDSWDKKTGYETKSILAVPMLARGPKLLGVIEVINKIGRDFEKYDKTLLMAFSSLAATALLDVEKNIEREKFIENVVRSFSETIDARSEFTAGHSQKVATYAKKFAKALKLDEKETKSLYYAALLHDVGKIAIKDSIIDKPGKLSLEEYQVIKDHVAYTRNILTTIDFPGDLAEIPQIASSHHEKIDGGGYPLGLKDQQIHKLAKILSIADVYESLTARDRPYRQALKPEEALDILLENRGISFDAQLVDLFIEKKVYLTEMRVHKRLNVDLAIDYFLNSKGNVKKKTLKRGKTLNISESGISFLSNIAFPFKKLIEIVIYIPSDHIETLAQVVHCNRVEEGDQFRVGLCFVDVNEKYMEKLKEYINEKMSELKQT